MYGMKLCFTSDGLVSTRTLGHELVVTLGLVVLVKFIEFDDAYQLGGIAWIGGIAGSLQTVCPSLIVGDGEIEKTAVSFAVAQELAMVLKTLECIIVGAETFLRKVIVVIDRATRPSMTFDAEMVVSPASQFTGTRTAFKDALSKRNTCRHTIADHFLNGQILILVDIALIFRVPFHLRVSRETEQYRYENNDRFLHNCLQN